MEETAPTLKLGSVHFSDSKIVEVKKGKITLSILRKEIDKIELRKGIAAERPLMQFLFGLILILPGLLAIPGIINWFINGGTLHIAVVGSFIALIPYGLWLALSAFTKRYLLLIQMAGDSRKIAFDRKSPLEEIREFIAKVSSEFGYDVSSQI